MYTYFLLPMLAILIFCYVFGRVTSCTGNSYGGYWKKKKKTTTAKPKRVRGMKKRGKSKNETEFWEIPDYDKDRYNAWLMEYYANMSKMQKKNEEGDGPEGMSMPGNWKGYGLGNGGNDPPPWAIIEGAHGKPDFCFFDPDRGDCIFKMMRWGFNSYSGNCTKFTYSGCGGNSNNFLSESRCRAACIDDVQSNCQQQVDQYYEY